MLSLSVGRTAKYLKKKATRKEEESVTNNIETFEEKTKRLLSDDTHEWHRFQEELRENGIVTNFAVEIVFYHYIKIRAAEQEIDKCVDKWEESQASFKKSLSNFRHREGVSRARAA